MLKEYPTSPLAIEPITIVNQERELLIGTFELYGRAKVGTCCRADLEAATFAPKLARVDDRSRWKHLGNI